MSIMALEAAIQIQTDYTDVTHRHSVYKMDLLI